MEAKASEYKPGKCNIGSAEIARRIQMGIIFGAVTVIVWALFVFFDVRAVWRLILLIPAALSASGFIQAYLHFCAGFGLRGVFNFDEKLYQTSRVKDKEFKRLDRAKALRIGWLSIAIGAVVALIAYLF